MLSLDHVLWVGFDVAVAAGALLAAMSTWSLAFGVPPLSEASFMVTLALFGLHWLLFTSDILGFYVGLECANFAGWSFVPCTANAALLWTPSCCSCSIRRFRWGSCSWEALCSSCCLIQRAPLFAAYGQPMPKPLPAHSAIDMNDLLLFAVSTMDPAAVWSGLGFYLWSLLLLWLVQADPYPFGAVDWHRGLVLALLTASLAGLPPLVGFLGKATISFQLASTRRPSCDCAVLGHGIGFVLRVLGAFGVRRRGR